MLYPPADDQLLLSPDNVEIAFLISPCVIACIDPAIPDLFPGFLWKVKVSPGRIRSLEDQLAHFFRPQLIPLFIDYLCRYPGYRDPNGTGLSSAINRIGCHQTGGLCQPVDFNDIGSELILPFSQNFHWKGGSP